MTTTASRIAFSIRDAVNLFREKKLRQFSRSDVLN
jgi:hypothetical protein